MPLDPPHPRYNFAVGNFRRLPNRAISNVTDQIGLSGKAFHSVVRQQVGLTPKPTAASSVPESSETYRSQQQLHRLAANRPDCVIRPAHFIHDFRAFSGIIRLLT